MVDIPDEPMPDEGIMYQRIGSDQQEQAEPSSDKE